MTKTQATAEVFWTAFRVLPREEQEAVLQRIVKDKGLRRALVRLARGKEITRSVRATKKRGMTARQLATSEIVGLWADRTDIGDSVEFARQLREKAQRRG
jgi:replicative DNA helicase